MKNWDSIVERAKSVRGVEQFGPLVIPSASSFYRLMVYAVHAYVTLGVSEDRPVIDINSFVSREEWLRNYGAYHLELLRQYKISREKFFKSVAFCSSNLQFCSMNAYVMNYLIESTGKEELNMANWEGCFSDGLEYIRSRVLLDRMILLREADYNVLSSALGEEAIFDCGWDIAGTVLLVLRSLCREVQANSIVQKINIIYD